MSVSVAQPCIEYAKICGGEKKSSNGCVACQRRSHSKPKPNARMSKMTPSPRRRDAMLRPTRSWIASDAVSAVAGHALLDTANDSANMR